jgi:hypothetical protein
MEMRYNSYIKDEIDISSFPNGIYLLQIQFEDGIIEQRKFIKYDE